MSRNSCIHEMDSTMSRLSMAAYPTKQRDNRKQKGREDGTSTGKAIAWRD